MPNLCSVECVWLFPVTAADAALLKKGVSVLKLSTRAEQCLRRGGISTVGDLTERSVDDLVDIRNFGLRTLQEIRERLKDAGMGLRDDAEEQWAGSLS